MKKVDLLRKEKEEKEAANVTFKPQVNETKLERRKSRGEPLHDFLLKEAKGNYQRRTNVFMGTFTWTDPNYFVANYGGIFS